MTVWKYLISLGCVCFQLAAYAKESSVAARMELRSFPSVFQAWNPAENLNRGAEATITPLSKTESTAQTQARHDLIFTGWNSLGLKTLEKFHGLATRFEPESIQVALQQRRSLLSLNPDLVLLAEIRYRDAAESYLPSDSPWWKKDAQGNRVLGWKEGRHYRLNYGDPGFQDQIAQQCRAVLKTGVFDGCMFDWWSSEDPDKIALIKKVRAAIGEDAILLVNTNGKTPNESASYINGAFMEGFGAKFFSDWKTAASSLVWAQSHFHRPVITALEGWTTTDRNAYAQMRSLTALSLTHSNGYVLFADPNTLLTPDHLHDWYPFWDKSLGRPKGAIKDEPNRDGSFQRNFDHGTAVFNPPSNHPVRIQFLETRRSAATGKLSRTHHLDSGDGDLFLKK